MALRSIRDLFWCHPLLGLLLLSILLLICLQIADGAQSTISNECQDPDIVTGTATNKKDKDGANMCEDEEIPNFGAGPCWNLFGPHAGDPVSTRVDSTTSMQVLLATVSSQLLVVATGGSGRDENDMRSNNCDIHIYGPAGSGTFGTSGTTAPNPAWDKWQKACAYTCAKCCLKPAYDCKNTITDAEKKAALVAAGTNVQLGVYDITTCPTTKADAQTKCRDETDQKKKAVVYYLCPASCGLYDKKAETLTKMKDQFASSASIPSNPSGPSGPSPQPADQAETVNFLRQLLDATNRQQASLAQQQLTQQPTADLVNGQDLAAFRQQQLAQQPTADLVNGPDLAQNCQQNISATLPYKTPKGSRAFRDFMKSIWLFQYYREIMDRDCAATCRQYFQEKLDDYDSTEEDYSDPDSDSDFDSDSDDY